LTIWCQVKVKHFFEMHPVFRYEEFAAFMTSLGTNRPESWRQQLSYHQKAGHLIHIRKFLYAVKPMFTQDQWIDPYLLTSKITVDAIIAYHTALELHGIAYTTFNELTFLSRLQVLPFTYEAQRFRSVSYPKILKSHNIEFGVEVINYNGMAIKLTCLERTIVDVLDRPNLSGGWEEIWRSFDNVTKLDMDKMIEYVLLLKNSTTIAKLGFFLEQRPAHLAVDKKYIQKLLPHISKQPHYMNRNQRSEGKYIEKWQLIVPLSIINRTWEESDIENI
jgi:predicted transcriptional regulator of viral defense system